MEIVAFGTETLAVNAKDRVKEFPAALPITLAPVAFAITIA